MTRSRDVADTQDNLGGAVAPFVAGKNSVINGGFDNWQRGTTSTANSNAAGTGYTADRWQVHYSGGSMTTSQQATGDTTNLPNVQYCARVQRNSGQTTTQNVIIIHTLETLDSVRFTGQTVTLSFYARAGANYSAASNGLIFALNSGTGTNQNVLWTFTGSSTVVGGTKTLTTTWQRFTATGTVPTSATELGFFIYYTPTGTAGANDYFEITGVQLELGAVATPFARAGGSIGGELALCQRYYWRSTPGGAYNAYGNGGTISTTGAYLAIPFPVFMRTNATTIDYANLAVQTSGGVLAGLSSLTIDQGSPINISLAGITGSSWTANQPCRLINNNNSAGYLGFGAEL
jgi:hypothetical protein